MTEDNQGNEVIRFQAAVLADLVEIRRLVETRSKQLGGTEDPVTDLVLAVNEAVTNIMVHGYKEEPGCLEIAISRRGAHLIVIIRDQSPPYNPNNVPSPDTTLPLEYRQPGGMGVHMMRSFVDEMTYRAAVNGVNELTLIKWHAIKPESQQKG